MTTETTFSKMRNALSHEASHGEKLGNFPPPAEISPEYIQQYLDNVKHSAGDSYRDIMETAQQYVQQFHSSEEV